MGKLIVSAKPNKRLNYGPASKSKSKRSPRPKIAKEVKRKVYMRDSGSCVMCHENEINLKKMGRIMTYDHIIPWRAGGEHTVENLQLMCDVCNEWKSDKIV